jgi:hypothetical protein
MSSTSLAGSSCIRILVPVILICVILCCAVAWGAIGVIDEAEDARNRQTLVRTEVAIDTSLLPENPTIEDWYPIGLEVLQDNGWDLSPNLTSMGTIASCEPGLVLDEVEMKFADRYFDELRPSIKWGWISLDRHSNTASVWIEYQALQWKHSASIDLTQVEVGLQEALEIADRHGGRDYRESVNNECNVNIDLWGDEWRIRYREDESSRWEPWIIWIDAATGEAKLEQR